MDVKSLQEPCAGANDLLMLTQTDNLMDFAMWKFTFFCKPDLENIIKAEVLYISYCSVYTFKTLN